MAEPTGPTRSGDAVARLQRWEDAGGVWQVLTRGQDRMSVALLRCDGGEEADRFSSQDPALLEFVGERTSSLD